MRERLAKTHDDSVVPWVWLDPKLVHEIHPAEAIRNIGRGQREEEVRASKHAVQVFEPKQMIGTATQIHDVGDADPRFPDQQYLDLGVNAPILLALSGRGGSAEENNTTARTPAGWGGGSGDKKRSFPQPRATGNKLSAMMQGNTQR